MKKKIISSFFILAVVFAFFGLGVNAVSVNALSVQDENITHVVTFDLNGGTYNSSSINFTQDVAHGGLISEPNKKLLKRNNCYFDCWETSSGISWDFAQNIVEGDLTLFAKWSWDESQRVDLWGNELTYLTTKYYNSTGWVKVSSNSTIAVSGYSPIEMQGVSSEPFPTSDIEAAINLAGVQSDYGGCGPIAMMGIFDYFARYMGYTSIMNDPTNSTDRIALAYDVLRTTKTYEVASLSQNEILMRENDRLAEYDLQQSVGTFSGEKETLTLPNDYASAFNDLMTNKYHLNKQIKAHYDGLFVGYNQIIKQIKKSIDKGLPVTVWSVLTGGGDFANHYVNVCGYQEWVGFDRFGARITNYIFEARLNWAMKQTYFALMDSTMLDGTLSGIIYYTVEDDNQLIRPLDFASAFVNESGQGQYFFYDKTANITTSDGFSFGTTRLRCGYIEDKYVVLSANRANAGLAYLKMNFNIPIKAMNFDIAMWSKKEGLGDGDYVKLFYLDSAGVWQESINFNFFGLSSLKDKPTNRYIEFEQPTRGLKFEVFVSSPSGDRNKGRVVIGDMNLFY